jgi:ligand-binding sensor domain-containing protein/signal transduction histidine kinase
VNCLHRDRSGYLWIGTWEGLSRFDGSRFVSWDSRDGLPVPLVSSIAEDARGRLWVALYGSGVARLADDSRTSPPFAAYRIAEPREAGVVTAIAFDADGDLWASTEAGLYRAPAATLDAPRFEHVVGEILKDVPGPLLLDAKGRLWSAFADRLVELRGGRAVPHPSPAWARLLDGPVDLVEDGEDRLLLAYDLGIAGIAIRADGEPAWTRVETALPPAQEIRSLLRDSRGRLWIGTTRGLLRRDASGTALLTAGHGLADDNVRAILEDAEGNVWIATWLAGLYELSDDAIVSWTRAEGLPEPNVVRVVEATDGGIFVTAGQGGIYRIDGPKAMLVPGSDVPRFHNLGMRLFQDRGGGWWIGTDEGLFRAPGPGLDVGRLRKSTAADGFTSPSVFGAFHEDRIGRVFASGSDDALYRLEPGRSAAFVRVPLGGLRAPREILTDASGALWLAPYVDVGRVPPGGALERVAAAAGLADRNPRALFEDSRGWLWIGTRFGGVAVTMEPRAPHPRFTDYTTASGLPSNAVWSVTEDARGRMYLATAKGLCRLDPATGRIRVFTKADGLAGDLVNHCVRDRGGRIWAATSGGVSRIDPSVEERPLPAPKVFLGRVEIAGEQEPVPAMGADRVGPLVLPPSRNNLVVDFQAPRFRGRVLYQHRLEGVDEEWSVPGDHRSLNYARLAPGSYRFAVRALGEDGAPGAPAVIDLRILPPVWLRPWFLGAVAVSAGSLAFAWSRARARRREALAGIRRQIALDLHDDVGSGLAEIAILSEVAKRGGDTARDSLDRVAALARSLRESMSDIVWAVDPRKDLLLDLVRRMRQAAYGLLEAEGIRVTFQAPEDRELARAGLAPDRRRHILLVLKEALQNIARHAGASSVEVALETLPGALRLTVRDDGRGFDADAPHEGHGLGSLRRRAAELGATLAIRSGAGRGTEIVLTVPLRPHVHAVAPPPREP